MLAFKTSDYLAQIKRFITAYYAPVLNYVDLERLKIDAQEEIIVDQKEQKLSKADARNYP